MREIKDYLHLYIGCTLRGKTGFVKLMSVIAEIPPSTNWGIAVLNGSESYTTGLGDYKPELRPLSDMTDEEQDFRWNNFINIRVINQEVVAEEIRWLLSKRFDLFNLIPEGLAIDKTKLNSEPKDKRSVARDDDSSTSDNKQKNEIH